LLVNIIKNARVASPIEQFRKGIRIQG
jgi:hypothetical protein